MAYFQPASNTYAPPGVLRELYEQAISHPNVVGLAIGTRPDCVPDDVLDMLSELASRTYVAVEYGIQTMHNRSLEWMNRGHDHETSVDTIGRSQGRGFKIGAHVILGLPGETHRDMMATADELTRIGVDSVKVHNLYAVRNTRLAEQLARGEIRLMERREYVRTLVDFLERLSPGVVVERTSGDAPPRYLVGPAWCLDKRGFQAALLEEFETRDTLQGKAFWSADAGCETGRCTR
jgi:radical SAM protein (TIGR01212 family)